MSNWGIQLPDFPWDLLEPFKKVASGHPDGIIDLSVGTPVDPTPDVIQSALKAASDSPNYPTTIGLPEFRQAEVDWLHNEHQVDGLDLDSVIPSIGSKEIVAWLPRHLGIGAGDVIALPKTAYPTYEIGGLLAGAETVLADDAIELESAFENAQAVGKKLRMAWINSPSNPTGAVKSVAELQALVQWGRSRGVLLVSDECYIDLGWDVTPISLLHREVSGGDAYGLLVVHSL
ncbi:MAG: succinyldiaminopimelate transaminase, partial [Actinomycetota bacterium]